MRESLALGTFPPASYQASLRKTVNDFRLLSARQPPTCDRNKPSCVLVQYVLKSDTGKCVIVLGGDLLMLLSIDPLRLFN